MKGGENMRRIETWSKRNYSTLSLALIFLFLAVIVILQGGVTRHAEADSADLISVNVQALTIENPANDPYKWPPPIVEEIKLDDGKVLRVNRWGFIVKASGLPTEGKGDFWIASWKFLSEPTEVSGSAKARFTLTFLTFSRPEPSSVGEPIDGTLLPQTSDMYGGYYETAGAKIGVAITWEPANKPIVVSTLCAETGRGQGYILTGGSWTGVLTVLDSGINYVVVGNPNSDATLTYSGQLLWP
ncbi:MAG: hypothetical protein ACP5PQ_00035 [Thermoproteota archaeon]